MKPYALTHAVEAVREKTPLIHCITNYVTVNDCANALLAIGASPIMSDEPTEVSEITSICTGLLINIGTLNKRTIEAMKIAGETAQQLRHPIVLDPVGAGASTLRTETAATLMDALKLSVIRGNMSEIKALVGAGQSTRGVDVNPDDVVTEENLSRSASFARSLAAQTGALVAVTGPIDLVASADQAYAIFNGHPLMATITGSGCMLSAVVAAMICAETVPTIEGVVAALCSFGLAGQIAASRIQPQDGNATFRTYLIDALCTLTAEELEASAKVEEIR